MYLIVVICPALRKGWKVSVKFVILNVICVQSIESKDKMMGIQVIKGVKYTGDEF